jgi:hypothetical protein
MRSIPIEEILLGPGSCHFRLQQQSDGPPLLHPRNRIHAVHSTPLPYELGPVTKAILSTKPAGRG